MSSPSPNDVPLAVVIPAFRARFLREALAGFAAQTDRRFHVYVADDGSPENLAEIVGPFRDLLALTYRRFEDNLGVEGLVGHWHRAIALSHEPWIWLFSDDDVTTPECVATLLADLAREPSTAELRRFDVDFIDAASRVVRKEVRYPDRLDALGYARRLLHHCADPCMIQNVVFSRAAFTAAGGFVPTIGGYCSDCATWPRFAAGGGIRRLPGGTVRFRRHNDSVGAQVGFFGDHRRDAIASYREVILALRGVAGPREAARPTWRRGELGWFGHWFRYLPRPMRPEERRYLAEVMAELWPGRPLACAWYFWRNYLRVVAREATRSIPMLDAIRRRLLARR